mgnify:CR=1 FL=1
MAERTTPLRVGLALPTFLAPSLLLWCCIVIGAAVIGFAVARTSPELLALMREGLERYRDGRPMRVE